MFGSKWRHCQEGSLCAGYTGSGVGSDPNELKTRTVGFASREDPDEVALHEQPHLNLHYLPYSL